MKENIAPGHPFPIGEGPGLGLTGIIPFTHFGGVQKLVGSTFLRVHGLVAHAPDFECWQHGRAYDNLIFQKAYWTEMMELFEGPKILDICDPDWIQDGVDIVAVSSLVHAITCSSPALTQLVKKICPQKMVFHVADRLNFDVFPPPGKQHRQKAKKAVWFGFIHNAHEVLPSLLPSLRKHQLQLTIIANKPYSNDDAIKELGATFIQYDQSTAYHIIRKADMVLNPQSNKAFFKYKSNNKSLIAWKLGLPVAADNDDVERFMSPKERNLEVAEKYRLVMNEYNITRSAQEYRDILSLIRQQYFSNTKVGNRVA